jgi:O-antigen/teichoic acid export membrane protein
MSLKKSVTNGVKWTSVSQFGKQGIQFITTAILAHLLHPSDFGLLGMATIITGFVALFKDLGTSAAIIQRRDISKKLLSSIFWMNVAFGFIAMIVLFLLSPFIAVFFHESRVEPLLQLMSLGFFISAVGIVHQAVLERDMAFNKLAIIEITATIVGSIVGITSALFGYGVWSLVYQVLVMTGISSLLLWTHNTWKPKLILHWNEIKTVSSYSLNLTGFSIFNYFARNADNLLIGKFLGAQDLGYYALAYRLAFYPLQVISSVLGRVMFPHYSQIQSDDDRFRNIYLQMSGAISFLIFPLMLILFALAQPVILTVYGSQWLPVVVLIKILIPIAIVQSLGTTVGLIYQSKGRTDWMFRWGIVSGTMITISFIIGLRWGISGVASAYLITALFLTYPNFSIPFRLIHLNVKSLVDVIRKPLLCSLIAYVFLASVSFMTPDVSPMISIGILIPLACLLYLLLSWLINRDQMHRILSITGLKWFQQA